MSETSVEVLVIGGGVTGSSLAYHIARQGRTVLVVEQTEGAIAPAASWASAGGVRRQGRHPAEAMLASEAIARWPTLEAELDADMHYRQGGNLLVAETEAEAEQLASFVREQQANGFTDVTLLAAAEVRNLVPEIAAQVTAASYSPIDGQADPIRTTRAFAAAAQRHGATYWNATAALALHVEGQRVTGVQTARGLVLAEQVVLAAGAWSNQLTDALGIHLPIHMKAFQMLRSTSATGQTLRPVVSAVNLLLSLKQLPDGAFLLGGGWLGTPTADHRSYQLEQRAIDGNWAAACAIYPPVAQQQIDRAWCGLEAESVDEIPFVGAMPDWEGLFLAVGFSGHGFAISPAIGRSLADMLIGRATPELTGLSPARIAALQRN